MQDINIDKINNFLKREDLIGHDLLLRTKCLDTDSKLKAALKEREQLVSQINTLQTSLSNKESEIIKLNGMMESYVDLINNLVAEEKGE